MTKIVQRLLGKNAAAKAGHQEILVARVNSCPDTKRENIEWHGF